MNEVTNAVVAVDKAVHDVAVKAVQAVDATKKQEAGKSKPADVKTAQ